MTELLLEAAAWAGPILTVVAVVLFIVGFQQKHEEDQTLYGPESATPWILMSVAIILLCCSFCGLTGWASRSGKYDQFYRQIGVERSVPTAPLPALPTPER